MLNYLAFFILIILFFGIMFNSKEEHHMNCPYYYKFRYGPYHCPYCRRRFYNDI